MMYNAIMAFITGMIILIYIITILCIGAKIQNKTNSIALPWLWSCMMLVVLPISIAIGVLGY